MPLSAILAVQSWFMDNIKSHTSSYKETIFPPKIKKNVHSFRFSPIQCIFLFKRGIPAVFDAIYFCCTIALLCQLGFDLFLKGIPWSDGSVRLVTLVFPIVCALEGAVWEGDSSTVTILILYEACLCAALLSNLTWQSAQNCTLEYFS